MQTPKEIFLELLKPNGRPERVLKQYEALHMCLNDPINTYLRGNRRRGTVSRDRWGTTISFPADAPGAIPRTWRRAALRAGRIAAPPLAPPPERKSSWQASWARVFLSSAIFSWALKTPSPPFMSIPMKCTGSLTTSPTIAWAM